MAKIVNQSTKTRLMLRRLSKRKKIAPINNNNGGIFSGKVTTIRK